MKRKIRLLALLLALVVVGGMVIVGGHYLLGGGESGRVGSNSIEIAALERVLIGFYLGFREEEIQSPLSADSTPIPFTIYPGETAAAIGQRLQEAGLIRDAALFRLLVQYRGVDAHLEAGEYELRPNMSMGETVEVLQHGQKRQATVTIPEGWRVEQIAQLLAERGLVNENEFLALVQEGNFGYDFLHERPEGISLEGYLFPDTYKIPFDYEAEEIIDLMLSNFDQRFTSEMRQEVAEQGMSIHELLTVASLVEREAKIPEERPIIVSVYLNRWRAGWLLESDATAQYALGYQEETGQWWKSPISLEEMTVVDSPYNTYIYPGLPPGPICNPGLASIQAVLAPAETNYMFLYHKGDGSHAFAETYEEHLENQRIYGP